VCNTNFFKIIFVRIYLLKGGLIVTILIRLLQIFKTLFTVINYYFTSETNMDKAAGVWDVQDGETVVLGTVTIVFCPTHHNSQTLLSTSSSFGGKLSSLLHSEHSLITGVLACLFKIWQTAVVPQPHKEIRTFTMTYILLCNVLPPVPNPAPLTIQSSRANSGVSQAAAEMLYKVLSSHWKETF
jgi:hypothetical protein